MVTTIIFCLIVAFCIALLAYGMKEDDDDICIGSVIAGIIALIVVSIIAGIGGYSYSNNLKIISAGRVNIPIMQKRLARQEAEFTVLDFNDFSDLLRYQEKYTQLNNMRAEFKDAVLTHNEQVAKLRNRSYFLNPMIWMDDKRSEGDFIHFPSEKPEESDEPLYAQYDDPNSVAADPNLATSDANNVMVAASMNSDDGNPGESSQPVSDDPHHYDPDSNEPHGQVFDEQKGGSK